ncbi:hypothetical protein WL1483_67 [Aeromonas schubertii]|uniref:YnhF family membrane protein n=1 Tax=Aeromonas schubertii TaxID=652 RepID=A0A0S2SCM6_9GAMM|nr:hypothetical protein WL1483_67 [Aeromonas schubertii]
MSTELKMAALTTGGALVVIITLCTLIFA